MCVCVCVGGGGEGGAGLLPNKCYRCMDVLLREDKVYVDTVKLINNIISKLLFKFFISIDNVCLGTYM